MLNSVATDSVTADQGRWVPATGSGSLSAEDVADLYDRYGALAFTLAYGIVRDRGIAEDVVQESFLALWRNAHRFDPSRASMRTWLCRIVRNRAIDRLRGTAGRRRSDASLDGLTSLCGSGDVESDVLLREESRSIVTALAALPHSQREVIELAYYGGYSQAEIAVRTCRPLGTVKSRTRLALQALAGALRPQDGEVPLRAAG